MLDRLDALTQINLDDLVGALGVQGHRRLAGVARRLFFRPARTFARQMVDFDVNTGERGLAEAARLTARLLVRDVRVFGADQLPAGNFLALSNHPGLTDTLALFAALRRPDLRVIALDRPFLVSLENVSRHLLYLPEQPNDRVTMIRRVARQLKAGGTVLTFPAGHTEPDPDQYPGAVESLHTWLDSATLFVRLAPETAVIPVCVRGVTWAKMANHPLTRLRQSPDDRQLMASAMQLLVQFVLGTRPVTVRVQIGRPIRAVGSRLTNSGSLHEAVLDEMKRLIESEPEGVGTSALRTDPP